MSNVCPAPPVKSRALADRVRRRPTTLLVIACWRTSPRLALAALTGAVVAALLPVAFIVSTGALVGAAGGQADRGRVLLLALISALLFSAGQALGPWQSSVLAGQLGRAVTTALANRQTTGLLRPTTIAHLEDPAFLDQLARATTTGGIGPWAATVGLIARFTSRLIGLGSLALLAGVDWRLALLLTIALCWNVRTMSGTFLRLVEAANGRAAALRRTAYFAGLAREPRAAREIRVFGLADWLLGRFDSSWTAGMQQVWAERRGASRAALVAAVPLVLAVAAVMAYVVTGVRNGSLAASGAVVAVQALLGSMRLATVARSDSWISYGTAVLLAQDKLNDLLLADRSLVQLGTDVVGTAAPPRLELRSVTFRYPGADKDVLAGLDLTIPAGKSLGIVGVNGAGKTTLVKLLTRLHDPQQGVISADGVPLTALDPNRWQQRAAVVFQDFVKFPFTLAENIALPRSGQSGPPHERARAAGKSLGLDDIAGQLPQGWDTILSKQLGGADLSGGQWQRVALARAVAAVHGGAGLLILDEPTSQQDASSEAAVYNELLHIAQGTTTVLISHRLAAVRRADSIAVLDQGRVIEQGSHDELIARQGAYAAMFSVQAERFAADAEPTTAVDHV